MQTVAKLFKRSILSAAFVMGAVSPLLAENPWPVEDANSICKLIPEAQCTQAVRIGLQAPGLDMRHASMAQMRLDNANLKGANFEGAIMHLANLQGANLQGATLTRSHLHAVNLRGANLEGANLLGASLLDADLSGANLKGAYLINTTMIQANLSGTTWTDGRVCSEGSIGTCN